MHRPFARIIRQHETRAQRPSQQSLLAGLAGGPFNPRSDSSSPRSNDVSHLSASFRDANHQQISWYHSIAFVDCHRHSMLEEDSGMTTASRWISHTPGASEEASDWGQYYYWPWSTPSEQQENDHQKKLIWMTQQKPVNFQAIEDQMFFIEEKTKLGLGEKTFFVMAKNCARTKSAQSAEAIERLIFYWMIKFHVQGRLDVAPKENIFGMALQSWANSGHPSSREKVELVLQRMEDLERKGVVLFGASIVSYSTAIKAYAIQGDMKNAQAVFDRCMHAFTQGNESARPNVLVWNSLFNACAKSGNPDKWKLTENLFATMQRSYKEGILKDPPDTITYNSIINICSKSKQPQRAEFWLREMDKGYRNGNASAQPNEMSFNTVIDAHAKSGNPDAWKLLENLLGEMQRSYKEGILKDPPNKITYSSIINACAKAKQPQRAEFWLREMCKDYKNGNATAQPNAGCFGATINAWANSETQAGAEHSESVLNDMIVFAEETGISGKPNAAKYITVMNAYVRVGLPRKAEAVLQRQYNDFTAGNKRAALDAKSFNTIIRGWAKAKEKVSGDRAELLLDLMVDLHGQGSLEEGPNVDVYTATIDTWAILGIPGKARQAFDRMLDDFQRGNQTAQPNLHSIRSLLWAYSKAKLPNAGELADELLEEMKELRLTPDVNTSLCVHRCWECSLGHDSKAPNRLKELGKAIRLHELSARTQKSV